MTHTHTTALHRTFLAAVSILTIGIMGACAQSRPMMSAANGSMRASTGAPRAVAAAPDTAKTVLVEPLQAMVTKMQKLQPTGDADFDYAFQVKVYNEGIQNFLAKEVQSGKDAALKQMAQDMLTTSKTEESTINDILRQLSPSRPNQVFMQQQKKNIDAIDTQLKQKSTGDSLSSNIDKNFKMLFADQRQAILDLTQTYLEYGRNSSLKAYAQQLADKAKSEMAKMKATE